MKKFLALLVAIMMLLCGTAMAEPYTGEEVTLRVFGWETYADDIPDSYFGQWFFENLGNVKVESEICATDSQTLINLYLDTGDDMPDIMMYRNAQEYLDKYGDSGRLLNLNDYAEYMPEYQARREVYPHLSAYDTADGETFLIFPCLVDRASEVWMQNDGLMQKYGLETPKTWEEMKKCLEVVCAGEGWDGTNATPIYFINWGFGYNLNQFNTLWGIRRSPAGISYDYEKGEWVYNLLAYEDVYKEAVAEMAEAYAKGWIHKDMFSMDAATANVYANEEAKWLFRSDYVDSCNNLTPALEAGNLTSASMFTPVAKEGIKPYVCMDYVSDNSGWCFGINAECEHPEVAAMYLEFITSKDTAIAFKWGVEGVTYTVDENGVKSYTEEYLAEKAADKTAAWKKYGINGTNYYWGPYASECYAFDAVYAAYNQYGQAMSKQAQAGIANGEYQVYYGARTPAMDEVTKEDISMITNPWATAINEAVQQFVMGQKDLAEWDEFVAGLKDLGDIEWVLEQYNTAEQYPLPAQQADRDYPQAP